MSSSEKSEIDLRRFWESVDEAQRVVNSWPAWKRGVLEESLPATTSGPTETQDAPAAKPPKLKGGK